MRPFRIAIALVALLSLFGSATVIAEGLSRGGKRSTPRTIDAAQRVRPNVLAGFDPLKHELDGERLVSPLPGGKRALLTLDPSLQAHLASVLSRYQVPYGAVVALDPRTGKVLAYVSHSSENPRVADLCRDPAPPAASVFKLVTAAALLDRGVDPSEQICYRGGSSGIGAAHLEDLPAGAGTCATLPEAVGSSINAVFARLADRHLDQPTLDRYAEAFGFGHALPFDAPTFASRRHVPADRLARARVAAGFWHMHMSPLHGSLIAATIANDGAMPRAAIVERVDDESGRTLYRHEPHVFREVIPRQTARAVASMMEHTVTRGTSRRAFRDRAGRPFLPGIRVAGKTGSLSSERPYRAYSWWVGHAPAEHPQIALAVLVVNGPKWRIKASYVAKEALQHHLVASPRAARPTQPSR